MPRRCSALPRRTTGRREPKRSPAKPRLRLPRCLPSRSLPPRALATGSCVASLQASLQNDGARRASPWQSQGRQIPIAQIAFGRPDDAAALQLTVLLPDNVSFDKPVRFGADDDHLATLAFRRCLPNGCYASVATDFGMVRSLRAATKPGRLVFTDGGEHALTLPLSLRGLA